ncbi:MAG: hypothetical protein Unbinned1322contig1000_40 [Prokaryotic dsDNA virus sp.]|nr:hypothetical protein [Aequorivita sp.]QDP57296.1 MAG: hypothetical protein Unbinned1322contig1000_40 [Prokaryotic dsDNA virus sp.]|tara:strand:+ start:20968 stop:21378 length:411 start_codon:yes stop_codon:yes gene_type:complete
MIYYKKTNIFKYKLEEDYWIYLPEKFFSHYINSEYIKLHKTRLYVLKGYRWDGPSGPTLDTISFMRGSLIHDVLYQLIREKKLNLTLRREADKLLRKHCREDGMSWVSAYLVYKAVRIFGAKAVDPEGHIAIRRAP